VTKNETYAHIFYHIKDHLS